MYTKHKAAFILNLGVSCISDVYFFSHGDYVFFLCDSNTLQFAATRYSCFLSLSFWCQNRSLFTD